MSEVKRRKGSRVSPERTNTGILRDVNEKLRDEVDTLKKKQTQDSTAAQWLWKRRILFPLGILLGIFLGFLLIQSGNIQEMHANLTVLLDQYDIALPDLPEMDFSRLELEWGRIKSSIPEFWKLNNDGREFTVGDALKHRGLSAEYPVVLIPGVISTGLESWSTAPAYRQFFRQKMWGGLSMVTQVTFNQDKWISAMMLDPITGLDPPDAKLRAAEGIDAASSFIQGYWIWAKIVENLAVVNYDTNNLFLAPYDWRLSYSNLEVRDGYFSKLKSTIENFRKRQGKKSVLVAHSMGASVLLYFFKWVEAEEYGGGGASWVEDHVEAYISVGGTHLGVPKAMSAFLSGEMKDTVQMNPAGAYVLERFFSRSERRKLFHSWAGSASMWIKGGNTIWGTAEGAPDDTDGAAHTHGELIAFRNVKDLEGERNMTIDEATLWILEHTPSTFQKMMETNYSVGIEKEEEKLAINDNDPTKWSNPLEVRLPNAPSMKMYCVYGHGKETERSYWYNRAEYEHDDVQADAIDPICTDPEDEGCLSMIPPLDMPLSRRSCIDSEYSLTEEHTEPKVVNGVKMGEGDGTVGLLSLGAMCVEGWKRPRWNPAGINITTIELPHQPVLTQPRGGANTSDHVDILGSTGLNEIILKVATGAGHEVEENFVSKIREYAKKINWD